MEPIKISSFQVENTKRVRIVEYSPTQNGVAIIGGKNEQGKSSILDAIIWALGGEKYRPTDPKYDKSDTDPYIKIVLSNGLIVERKGKKSALTVTDPRGMKATQTILNEFIGQLALDLPTFLKANNTEKAKYLLRSLNLENELAVLDAQENKAKVNRAVSTKFVNELKSSVKLLPTYDDAPDEPIEMDDLLAKQDEILRIDADNQKTVQELNQSAQRVTAHETSIVQQKNKLIQGQGRLANLLKAVADEEKWIYGEKETLSALDVEAKVVEAKHLALEVTVSKLKDTPPLDSIKQEMKEVDSVNAKVRANQAATVAQHSLAAAESKHRKLVGELEAIRSQKKGLLDNAKLPLEGLTIIEGELEYKGKKWDGMSGSQRLKVAVAIVKEMYPKCGFVLMDGLEQFDEEQLNLFGKWLEGQKLQVVATKVSTGDECSIIIEDGAVK